MDANGSWTEVSPEQYINVTFPQSSHLFENLEEDTYYQVKINAFNDMRQSEVTKFIFKTGLNKGKQAYIDRCCNVFGRYGTVVASVTLFNICSRSLMTHKNLFFFYLCCLIS